MHETRLLALGVRGCPPEMPCCAMEQPRRSLDRTGVGMSGNLNHREPMNGVNTYRKRRQEGRNISLSLCTKRRTSHHRLAVSRAAARSSPRSPRLPAPNTCRPRSGSPDYESFERAPETFYAGSIDDPSSIPQSPCLRSGHSSRYRATSALSNVCCTADPRTAARQIRAPKHLRHPSRSGEVRTSASWLLAQLERYATPRGGPPAEPRWSAPHACVETPPPPAVPHPTAACRVGADDAFPRASVLP